MRVGNDAHDTEDGVDINTVVLDHFYLCKSVA